MVVGIPSLELLDGGVPWYGYPVQLQLRVPRRIRRAHLGHVPILLTLSQGGPLFALSRLWKLWRNLLIVGDHLPLLDHLLVLLPLLQIGRCEEVK